MLVYHKSEMGFVDLTFDGLGERISELRLILEPFLDDDMAIDRRFKSAVVRLKVPKLDFHKSFDEHNKDDLIKCFEKIERLVQLSQKLDVTTINKLYSQ